MNQVLRAFTAIFSKFARKGSLGGSDFPWFLDWPTFMTKFHRATIYTDKPETVFGEKLLKNRNVPTFAKGRPVKGDLTPPAPITV